MTQRNSGVHSGRKQPAMAAFPRKLIYPFFLIHMLIFGTSGFVLAYFGNAPVYFLYLHGGIAIAVYLVFYIVIFGLDSVKWMLVNALLGVLGLYGEIGALLSLRGKDINSYPLYIHFIPFMYYVLYTFLLRQIFIDISGSWGDERRADKVSYIYVALSIGASSLAFFLV